MKNSNLVKKLRSINVLPMDYYTIQEAADTIEQHQNEIEKLENRLDASNKRYETLYQSREAILTNFRIGITFSVLTTAIIMVIGYYLL